MIKMESNKKEVAECVGLWLAEGDKKTPSEVTFTNNCIELILFFHETIKPLYNGNNKPRIYVYSPAERILISNLKDFVIRNYVDKRANRTYYIYRLADVEFVKKWKIIVNSIKNRKEHYANILRGIFAGEGYVKHDLKNHNSRNLEIASGSRDSLIEHLLSFFNVKFNYNKEHRQYWITGRYLNKLNEIKIASLHPEKEAKFRKMIDCLKEIHYSPGELKRLLLAELNQFKRTSELAKKLRKSDLRILEVLQELKREDKIGYIRIKGNTYWIKKELMNNYLNEEKIKILKEVPKNQTLTGIGKYIGLSRKTIRTRLNKLQIEGLVYKKDGIWRMTREGRTVCGIDESGSEQ